MTTTQDLSFLSLVLNASLLVQLVMLLLLGMSIASWTIIFKKTAILRGVRQDTERFERDFWSGGDLHTLLAAAQRNTRSDAVLEHIFEAGMQEFMKVREIDAARRAMKATYQREMDALEANLPFLASVGSVSPYIGLFGTVWGIMHSFRGLANVQNATLSAVAPGIAEALIATAIGLFAAIPAVVAYNRAANGAQSSVAGRILTQASNASGSFTAATTGATPPGWRCCARLVVAVLALHAAARPGEPLRPWAGRRRARRPSRCWRCRGCSRLALLLLLALLL